eukprot:767615-Hanusia_phi.AAC.5
MAHPVGHPGGAGPRPGPGPAAPRRPIPRPSPGSALTRLTHHRHAFPLQCQTGGTHLVKVGQIVFFFRFWVQLGKHGQCRGWGMGSGNCRLSTPSTVKVHMRARVAASPCSNRKRYIWGGGGLGFNHPTRFYLSGHSDSCIG